MGKERVIGPVHVSFKHQFNNFLGYLFVLSTEKPTRSKFARLPWSWSSKWSVTATYTEIKFDVELYSKKDLYCAKKL